jgi:hypothetical protein
MKHPPLLERENSFKNVLLLYDEIKKNVKVHTPSVLIQQVFMLSLSGILISLTDLC